MAKFRENEDLQKLKLTFLYGETDFFWRSCADELVTDGTLKQAKVFTVPASGHHPYIDNPEVVVKLTLDNFLKNERA